MSNLPICTDCRHCRSDWSDGEFAKCRAPQGGDSVRKLTGARATETYWKYCSIHRGMWWITARLFRACGREGRWFEPKEDQ